MKRRITTPLHLLLAATALVAPGTAFAQSTPREAELEARLAKLEAEMQSLRADLASARSDEAATAAVAQEAAAKSNAAATKVAALQPQAVQAAPADGFRSGATTIKIGGFIKLTATNSRFSEGEAATNSLGRDFYLP